MMENNKKNIDIDLIIDNLILRIYQEKDKIIRKIGSNKNNDSMFGVEDGISNYCIYLKTIGKESIEKYIQSLSEYNEEEYEKIYRNIKYNFIKKKYISEIKKKYYNKTKAQSIKNDDNDDMDIFDTISDEKNNHEIINQEYTYNEIKKKIYDNIDICRDEIDMIIIDNLFNGIIEKNIEEKNYTQIGKDYNMTGEAIRQRFIILRKKIINIIKQYI